MYHQPLGVEESKIGQRPVLLTSERGRIAIDAKLLALWKFAIGKDLTTILVEFEGQDASNDEIRAGLACLVEAGLLLREHEGEQPKDLEEVAGPLISIVIVAHNSQEWLPDCLNSITKQNYQPIEIMRESSNATSRSSRSTD